MQGMSLIHNIWSLRGLRKFHLNPWMTWQSTALMLRHVGFVLWDLWECSKLVALCGVPLRINYCKFNGGVAFLWCGEFGCLNFKEWEKWFKQNTVACDLLLCQTQCERLAHFEFRCRLIANLSLAWWCKTTSSSLHCSIWSAVSASQFLSPTILFWLKTRWKF